MNKIDKAWLLVLNSDNYYTLITIGLYYDLLQVKTKYPVYCVVTEKVSDTDKNILKTIGIKLIEVNTEKSKLITLKDSVSRNNESWKNAFAKLLIIGSDFEKLFNKICYIDTDVRIFKNMDDIFNYDHMSAIEDAAPARKSLQQIYYPGRSIFCSGLFIWDYENHPNEGEEILDNLKKLKELKKDIIWHDQSVLNYFYQDWRDKESLHISPKYCLMNIAKNLKLVDLDDIYAIHYINKDRLNWPFKAKIIFKTDVLTEEFNQFSFKSWVKHITVGINYFNELYNLNILIPNADNIIELDKEKEIVDKPKYYLYF